MKLKRAQVNRFAGHVKVLAPRVLRVLVLGSLGSSLGACGTGTDVEGDPSNGPDRGRVVSASPEPVVGCAPVNGKPPTPECCSAAYPPSVGFPYRECGQQPSAVNHGTSFPDKVIQDGDLVVTTAPALAGAVASVRYKGVELIHSGGHGAALQYALHTWKNAGDINLTDECHNPTEAGNMADDRARDLSIANPSQRPLLPFPHHGPSSSKILHHEYAEGGAASKMIITVADLANYVPNGGQSDYMSCTIDPGYSNDDGTTGYVLQKNLSLSAGHILTFDSQATPKTDLKHFDVQLVTYLNGRFKNEYFYDTRDNGEAGKVPGEACWNNPGTQWACSPAVQPTPGFDNLGRGTTARLFADPTSGVTVGLLTIPNASTFQTAQWTATELDDEVIPGYEHPRRNLAGKHVFNDVRAGVALHAKTYVVVGSLDEVRGHLRNLCFRDGFCDPSASLQPLHRYYNAGNGRHLLVATPPAPSLGYREELGFKGKASLTREAGMEPLYHCWVPSWNRAFFSRWSNCEGVSGANAQLLGYVWTQPGAGRSELFRCYLEGNNAFSDHFATLDPNECTNAGAKHTTSMGFVRN